MTEPAFRLTLTFDNGPSLGVTGHVLDLLAERGIKTTFFVLGHKMAESECRRLAERAHREGHWIGNHTWSHSGPLGTRAEPGVVEHEIGQTQDVIGALAHPDRLFRPQGGGGRLGPHLLSPAAADYLGAGRFTCVLWNSVPRDWILPDAWVERALDDCAHHDWTLMVLHDLPTGAMRHLPRFLDEAARHGAEFHQDFPPECLPMVRGRAQPGFEAITTRAEAAAPA